MFRRKKSPDQGLGDDRTEVEGAEDEEFRALQPASEEAHPATDPSDDWTPRPVDPPQGPWDELDVPDDGTSRLDLGGLRVPLVGGVEARVEVDGEGHVIAATLVVGTSQTRPDGTSLMQLTAFAAPRSAGIWAEVRAEIAAAITEGGGRAEIAEGLLGPEVRAHVPGAAPGQLAPARFIGVDGPRWFLRAAISGAAAGDPQADPILLELFRGVVVVRGEEAMAVRDMLALRMPKEITDAAGAADPATAVPDEAAPAAEQETADYSNQSLNPFLRGPEITEVR